MECEGIPPSPTEEEMSNATQQFSIKDLGLATQNFNEDNLLGEGGFGRVYKGLLPSGQVNFLLKMKCVECLIRVVVFNEQVVAIKQLNHEGLQGSKEFLVECLMLLMLHHTNLVNLIGYCAQGDERLLVYEYMSQGSLEQHLFDLPREKEPLDWNTRIKIALGASKGLTYLHDVANPPVIYRDLKSANILLDNEFNPKLSDFGLAKLGPVGDNTHVSTRVMGTYGYCAPDYAMSGKLTVKSDVYSFGVLLLELISGRKAFDQTRPMGEQNIFVWSRPFLKDKKRFMELADPLLRGRFPVRPFYQLVMITSMCLHEDPRNRPASRDVASAIEHVATQPYNSLPYPSSSSTSSSPRPRVGRSKGVVSA